MSFLCRLHLHCCCPYSGRAHVDQAFGRPLQVTARPMLRDRYPVCLSVTLVYCGQMVGWIKMPLGTEVGLGPGGIVLDGDPAPHGEGHSSPSPTFRPTLLWHGRPSQQLLSSCLKKYTIQLWRSGSTVARWSRSTKLLCVGPG